MLVLVLVFILAVEAAGSTFLWLRLGKLKNDIVNASIRRSDALAVELLNIENSLRRILDIIHTVQSLQFQIRDKIQEE